MKHPVLSRVKRDCDDAQRVWDSGGMRVGIGPKVVLYVHDVRFALEKIDRMSNELQEEREWWVKLSTHFEAGDGKEWCPEDVYKTAVARLDATERERDAAIEETHRWKAAERDAESRLRAAEEKLGERKRATDGLGRAVAMLDACRAEPETARATGAHRDAVGWVIAEARELLGVGE